MDITIPIPMQVSTYRNIKEKYIMKYISLLEIIFILSFIALLLFIPATLIGYMLSSLIYALMGDIESACLVLKSATSPSSITIICVIVSNIAMFLSFILHFNFISFNFKFKFVPEKDESPKKKSFL